MNAASLLFATILFTQSACAQILVAQLPKNQPTKLNATVAYDESAHIYKYSYQLLSEPTNTAPADTLVVKIEPGVDVITNITAPNGWQVFFSENRGTISWAAVDFIDDRDYLPGEPEAASDYAVAPGRSLSGFSFESFSPPGNGSAITQTFAPIPVAVSEDDFPPQPALGQLPENNGFSVQTTVPVPDVDWNGNRRPTVDGFLVFGNLKDKDAFVGSVFVVIRFAAGGEVVQMDTFRVRLNNVDVANKFVYDSTYKGYVARFEPSQGILVSGSNVLLTSISGTIPGILDKPVVDTDRVSFKFTP